MIWFIRILGLLTVAIFVCLWLDTQSNQGRTVDVESFGNPSTETSPHVITEKNVHCRSTSDPTTINPYTDENPYPPSENVQTSFTKTFDQSSIQIDENIRAQDDDVVVAEDESTALDEEDITLEINEEENVETETPSVVEQTYAQYAIFVPESKPTETVDIPPRVRYQDETYAYYKKPTTQTELEKEEAGYVYLPSQFWSIPQKRPPACTPSAKPKVCPVYTDGVPDGALEWKLTARERQVRRSSNRPTNAQHLRNSKNRYYYPGYYAQGDTYKHSC